MSLSPSKFINYNSIGNIYRNILCCVIYCVKIVSVCVIPSDKHLKNVQPIIFRTFLTEIDTAKPSPIEIDVEQAWS